MLSHSSRVKWAKILFPIIAVGAIVYVMSVDWTNEARIVGEFKEEDKVFQDNSANVEKPKLDVTTTSGDNYTLEASSVESLDGSMSKFSGGNVTGDLTLEESHWVVESDESVADIDGQTVEFTNAVKGILDNAYIFTTEQLLAELGVQQITGEQRVEMVGKLGQVEADSFHVSGRPTERIITLTGNVVGQFEVEKSSE